MTSQRAICTHLWPAGHVSCYWPAAAARFSEHGKHTLVTDHRRGSETTPNVCWAEPWTVQKEKNQSPAFLGCMDPRIHVLDPGPGACEKGSFWGEWTTPGFLLQVATRPVVKLWKLSSIEDRGPTFSFNPSHNPFHTRLTVRSKLERLLLSYNLYKLLNYDEL